jgi:hypothetical protein
MKTIFFSALLSFMLVSCGNSSKKGAWSETDKNFLREEIKKVDSSFDAFGESKEAYIACYMDKLEANYSNFNEANADGKGCEMLAMECLDVLLDK